MKRFTICTLILLAGLAFNTQVNAQGFEPGQGFKQINFGVGVSGNGIPVYAGMDFGVADKITIGPRVDFRWDNDNFTGYGYDYTIFNISFRGDYHWGAHIDGLPEELDLYGGLSLGYSIWSYDYDGPGDPDFDDSDVYIAVQAGARWYFSPNWGVNAELSGGSLSGLNIGMSYAF